MTTAGSQGFLNLLPVYLDHVVYPVLTACKNTGENRTRRAMFNAMYPGRCGYKSETGGALRILRTSTSHAKVVAYHREFYRLENLSVIVTGQVEPQQVLDSLQAFEQKIREKSPRGDCTRRWLSPVPPLTESLTQTVRYASDDEKNGMVLIGWQGPRAKDQYGQSALMILLEYVTDTAVSPLQIEQPYCNDVKYSMIENSEGCMYIKFTNVPVAKLFLIQDKLLTSLRRLGSGEETLDLERMRVVVKKREQEAMSALEDEPHDTVSSYVIGDVLYGDDKQDLEQRLNQVKQFRQLEGEAAEFWTQLLNK